MGMKKTLLFLLIPLSSLFIFQLNAMSDSDKTAKPAYNKLTPQEEWVILHKGTERPGTGDLLGNKDKGTYICARCQCAIV